MDAEFQNPMLKHLEDTRAGISRADIDRAWAQLRASLPPKTETLGRRGTDPAGRNPEAIEYRKLAIPSSYRVRELERRISRLEQRYGLAEPSPLAEMKGRS